MSPCDKNPCLNDAVCIEDKSKKSGFKCNCAPSNLLFSFSKKGIGKYFFKFNLKTITAISVKILTINVERLHAKTMVYVSHLAIQMDLSVNVSHHFQAIRVQFFQIRVMKFQTIVVKTLYAHRKQMVALVVHVNRDIQVVINFPNIFLSKFN